MYEQDYLMRVIKEMVRVILKLLCNIDTESPTTEMLESKEEKECLENLLDMIDAGKINEAENRVYDILSNMEMGSIEIALLFYSYLNDKTDPYLVALIDGEIAGYICAGRFRTRASYAWSASTSIYIDKQYHRMEIRR